MNKSKQRNLKNLLAVMAITILIYMTYILLSVLAIMLFTGSIHIISGQSNSSLTISFSKIIAAGMGVISVVYFLKIWKKIIHYAEDLVYRRKGAS